MSVLNSNIPSFKALVKKSFFTKNPEDSQEFYNVYVFAIQSLSGQILTFHVMTDHGMVRSRVPISEIYTKVPENDIPFNFKQLWDCFGEKVSVIEYDFLAFHRAQIGVLICLQLIGMVILIVMNHQTTNVDTFSNPTKAILCVCLTTEFFGEIQTGLPKTYLRI